MKSLAIAGSTCLAVSAFIAGALGADIRLRKGLHDKPQIERVPGVNQGRIFVLLPAAQAESANLYPLLRPVLQDYGSYGNALLIVDGGIERFNADKLIDAVCKEVVDYTHVTFVGADMGFMLAWDIATKLRRDADWQRTDILSIDGITGGQDLVMEDYLHLGAKLYPGPICNKLFTKPVWKIGFRPDLISEIKATSKTLLYALRAGYMMYPLSKWTDALRYISEHAPLEPSSVRTAMIQSIKDTRVVRPETARVNHRQLGEVTEVVEVESGHIGLLDWPARYKEAVLVALDSLDNLNDEESDN